MLLLIVSIREIILSHPTAFVKVTVGGGAGNGNTEIVPNIPKGAKGSL